VQVLDYPRPCHVRKHGIFDHLGFKLRSNKDDASKGAFPLVDPIGVVQEHEPSRNVHGIRISHVNGDGEGGWGESSRCGRLGQEKFWAWPDSPDLLDRHLKWVP